MGKFLNKTYKILSEKSTFFFQSDYFIYFFGVITFIFSIFNIPIYSFAFALFMCSLVLFTQKNTKPLLVMILMVYLTLQIKNGNYNLNFFFYFACLSFISSLVYYTLKNKPKLVLTNNIKGLFIYGLSFITGGLFSASFGNDYSVFINVGMCLLVPFALFVFELLINTIEFEKKEYVFKCLTVTGVVIAVQLLTCFFTKHDFIALIKRDCVVLNWGVYDSITTYLLFSITSTLYMSLKSKHYKIYFALSFVFMLIIFLTSSRGGIMVSILLMSFCVPYTVKHSDYKKQLVNEIYLITGIIIFSIIIQLIFYNRLLDAIFNSFRVSGFSGTGRIEIWIDSLYYFIKNPVFGLGFLHGQSEQSAIIQFWHSHNIILEAMSSGGLVALAGLLIHKIVSYKSALKKDMFHFYMLTAFIITDLYGMIDCTYPAPYCLLPVFILIIAIDNLELKNHGVCKTPQK